MRGDHMEVIALLQKYGGKVRPPDCTLPQPPCTTGIGPQHLASSAQLAHDNTAAMLVSLNCCR